MLYSLRLAFLNFVLYVSVERAMRRTAAGAGIDGAHIKLDLWRLSTGAAQAEPGEAWLHCDFS